LVLKCIEESENDSIQIFKRALKMPGILSLDRGQGGFNSKYDVN